MRAVLTSAALAVAVGLAGGAIFRVLGMPLAWTLGSLTAAAVVAVSGRRWLIPNRVRDLMRMVVGVLAGSSFTPAAVAGIAASWPALLFVMAQTALTMLAGWFFFRRYCRFDPATSFFASSPGGLSDMTLLGALMGGDMRSLALIHAIRIVAVVFTVPVVLQVVLGHPIGRVTLPNSLGTAEPWEWVILIGCGVAGWGLGKLWRFPAGTMIGALLFSATVHGTGLTQLVPPGWLIILVQILIGSMAGSRFAGVGLRELGTLFYQALLWAAVLLLMAIAAAAVAARLFGQPFAVFLLALAPGGLTEMTVISYTLGIDVSFVILCQISRIFLVSGCMPTASRLAGIRRPLPPDTGPKR